MTSKRRWVGIAFVLAATVLVAWNLAVLWRNQHSSVFVDGDKLAVRSTKLADIAKANSMSAVNTAFATYYAMRKIAGKHLLLPADLAQHAWWIERVAHVHVEVSPKRLELPRAVAQRIFDGESNQSWAIQPQVFTGVHLERGVDHYVLAWRAGDNGVTVLIPEARYERALNEVK